MMLQELADKLRQRKAIRFARKGIATDGVTSTERKLRGLGYSRSQARQIIWRAKND